MISNAFLAQYFPTLALMPALFYEWQPAIRFELGDPEEQNELAYRDGSYRRALSLYEQLHAPDDECIIVMDVYEGDLRRQHLVPFLSKERRFHIAHSQYEMDEALFYRFEVACTAKEIAHVRLLRAIVHMDLGMKPRIPHRVYILNKQTQTIFHVYDDRGCDVLASALNTLQPLYKQYNAWILDYDRATIDQLFK